jgi:type II secretory pathway pseudopilin PulG
MSRRDAGITLVEISAAVVVVAIILAILLPVMARAGRLERLQACQGHLHAMFEAQAKAPPEPIQASGRAYWGRLTQTQPPLLDPSVLKCPFVDAADAPYCQYYGPAGDITNYDPKDPIGCDIETNHSDDGSQGGNVLLKSGSVVTDHTGAWGAALRGRKCAP